MTKEQVLDVIRALPDTATVEDVIEHLCVLKIENGFAQTEGLDTGERRRRTDLPFERFRTTRRLGGNSNPPS